MNKTTLSRASQELFRRSPDESFATLNDLWKHCQTQRNESTDLWERPESLLPLVIDNRLELGVRDWSSTTASAARYVRPAARVARTSTPASTMPRARRSVRARSSRIRTSSASVDESHPLRSADRSMAQSARKCLAFANRDANRGPLPPRPRRGGGGTPVRDDGADEALAG